MTNKTITLEEPGRFVLGETDAPSGPGPGDVLVAVRRIGICGTDLHAFRGQQPYFSYPRVLGHELGVEVLELGEGAEGVSVGDRCAVEPYLNCGRCRPCLAGRTNCCSKLQVLGVHIDGGMRQTITVPANKLHKSDCLRLEQLALVETLGIGAHAVDRSKVVDGEDVLVIGAGPIGLAVTQFAQIAGGQVTVLDINRRRLAFCRDLFGVPRTIVSGEDGAEPIDQVREAFGGELPTVVFDATGFPPSMNAAFELTGSGGRLTMVSLVQGDISFNDPEFHRKELTVLATRNSTATDFRRIISLIESGTADTTPWISHRTDFDEMIGEFPNWLDPEFGVIKAMVELE
jgi:2-desacetyl-2-hydroxyethyl bacteriochlorophyllide A dehydrogenase